MVKALRTIGQGLAARLLTYTGIRPAWGALQGSLRMPCIVAVNYHWTPASEADALARQFEYFQEHFTSIDRAGLEAFFSGTLHLDKPGILVCFDDGSRNTHEVAAPLLERHGLRGWYFVIAGIVDPHFGGVIPGMPRKFCMSIDQVRDLHARGHVVGSHTYAHLNLGSTPAEFLHREIVASRSVLEDGLGAPVEAFCYPFGTSDSFSPAAQALVQAHYRFAFTNFPTVIRPRSSPQCIGRHSVSPGMSSHLVRLKTSGLLNWSYRRARRAFMQSLPAGAAAGCSDQTMQ